MAVRLPRAIAAWTSHRPGRGPGREHGIAARRHRRRHALGYLGSFTGPPLVGALAELTDLTLALAVLVVAAALTCVLARPALRSHTSA